MNILKIELIKKHQMMVFVSFLLNLVALYKDFWVIFVFFSKFCIGGWFWSCFNFALKRRFLLAIRLQMLMKLLKLFSVRFWAYLWQIYLTLRIFFAFFDHFSESMRRWLIFYSSISYFSIQGSLFFQLFSKLVFW